MKQRVRALLQLAVVFALVLSLAPFQAIAQESLSEKADLIETAIAAGDFTVLVDLVEAAGLTETLQGEGPFTVFAPTDAAFAAVPADVLDALAADPAALQSVLLYHVVPGRMIAALISDGKEVATAEGSNVVFSFVDGVKKINGATIIAKDIQASNGVIQVIDSVLLPPELAAALGVEAAPADAEATPAATEEAAAEATATPAATEEAAAEATPVATEEAAAEATPAATEAAAAEATPAATEEAAAEATPAATEEAAAEATPAAAEEAAAEATPVATEEAAAEAPAPDSLPVTGGESNTLGLLAAALVLIVVAGVAMNARRRLA